MTLEEALALAETRKQSRDLAYRKAYSVLKVLEAATEFVRQAKFKYESITDTSPSPAQVNVWIAERDVMLRRLRAELDLSEEEVDAGIGVNPRRDDGLSAAEGEVMDALVAAVEAFGRLDRQHPQELSEFVSGIHTCQHLLAVRLARYHHPEGWPTHASPFPPPPTDS